MHGLGNDFVMVEGISQSIALTPHLIRRMSDRHRGIGFDQLIWIEKSRSPQASFHCRIFNADGTESAQCGNGIRCVGRFLKHHQWLSPEEETVCVTTAARRFTIYYGEKDHIGVDMGPPVFAPEEIPFQSKDDVIPCAFSFEEAEGVVLSMGNPHAVVWVEDIEKARVEGVGAPLSKDKRFPQGVNVSFMQVVHPQKILLRVYERGVGETLACGSGACAAVVAGCMRDVLKSPVHVVLPGGSLHVEWKKDHLEEGPPSVYLLGPTEVVFEGRWISSLSDHT